MSNITVAILAAGTPKKMKSGGPISLVKTPDNKNLIDDQISKIRYIYRNPKIFVVTGYQHSKVINKFKNENVEIIYNENFEDTNSADSLSLCLQNNPNQNLLMIHGDMYFNIDTLRYISNIHYTENSAIIYDDRSMMKSSKPGILRNNFRLEHMTYFHKEKWASICFFNNYEYKILKTVDTNKKYTFEIINQINEDSNSLFYCHNPRSMNIIEVECTKDLKSEQFKNINC